MTLRLYKAPKFRKWVELEEKKGQVIRAVEETSADFPKNLISFLSTALTISPDIFYKIPWQNTVQAFYLVASKNAPRISIPLIVEYEKAKGKEDIWDYSGRSWHLYSHLLAKNYGWSLEYISNLEVDEALAKIQEILTDEQLNREFYWAASEIAYSYDSRTKTSKFVPLNRPVWMRQTSKEVVIPKTKILRSLMPVGAVDWSSLGKENEPKEIKRS